MTTFHNFALEIETGWATKVVMSIKLEMFLIDFNGFEVSQNSILHVFCYKICTLLEE